MRRPHAYLLCSLNYNTGLAICFQVASKAAVFSTAQLVVQPFNFEAEAKTEVEAEAAGCDTKTTTPTGGLRKREKQFV